MKYIILIIIAIIIIKYVKKRKRLATDPEYMKQKALEYTPWGKHGDNPQKRFEWYMKAAEAGDAFAMLQVARAFCIGDVITQDHKIAFIWFEKAAKLGYAQGYMGMADEYREQYSCSAGYKLPETERFSLQQKEYECLYNALNCCDNDDDASKIYCSLGLLFSNPTSYCYDPFRAIDAYEFSEKFDSDGGYNYAKKAKNDLMKEHNISEQDFANWRKQFK